MVYKIDWVRIRVSDNAFSTIMQILLTNDDGIHSEGLWALYRRFSRKHTVTVVAPDRERSAIGHGITLDRPLRAFEVAVGNGFRGFAVTGTPADCIKLGVLEILRYRPDLVISGINAGINVGININYSGTVAGAREAALNGIAAAAVSVQGGTIACYEDAAAFTELLSERIFQRGLPFGTFLNVNIPDCSSGAIRGIRISRQGVALFSEYFEKRKDPRDRTYYWQGCDMQPFTDDSEIDGDALRQRFISITPIKCDTTDYAAIEAVKSWKMSLQEGICDEENILQLHKDG